MRRKALDVASGDLTPHVASGDLTLNVAKGDLTPYATAAGRHSAQGL